MGKNLEVLLVDDNIADVDLIKECINNNGNVTNIFVLNDGVDVFLYLNKKNIYNNSKRPDIIILDLNLPYISGFEILEILKLNEDFKTIPVIILSSSASSIDIKRSYKLYANAYIVKPNNLLGFRNIVKQIESFWFKVAELSS